MTTAWAVVFIGDDGSREIVADTIRRTRTGCICATFGPARRSWRRFRRAGRVACVRVEVREVEG